MKPILYSICAAALTSCASLKICEKQEYVPEPRPVTNRELWLKEASLSSHYDSYCQSYGIIYPGLYLSKESTEPERFAAGADSALFTGMALAGFCYKGVTTGDFRQAEQSLAGTIWLTQAAGPGVICRAVIPKDSKGKWNYPNAWQSRIDSGFVGESPPISYGGLGFPAGLYYTRATRDQLTGILYGLSAAWIYLPDRRLLIALAVRDIMAHILKYDFKIRDQNGRNDTSADSVDNLLLIQLSTLYSRTENFLNPRHNALLEVIQELNFDDWKLKESLIPNEVYRLNNYKDYYAHNLRIVRALTIWSLENSESRKRDLVKFVQTKIWAYTKKHQNAWLASVVHHMTGDPEARRIGLESLGSLSRKSIRGWGSPLVGQWDGPTLVDILNGCDYKWVLPPELRKPTNYFTWVKEPWDVGEADPNGYLAETGLDFILPYWLLQLDR